MTGECETKSPKTQQILASGPRALTLDWQTTANQSGCAPEELVRNEQQQWTKIKTRCDRQAEVHKETWCAKIKQQVIRTEQNIRSESNSMTQSNKKQRYRNEEVQFTKDEIRQNWGQNKVNHDNMHIGIALRLHNHTFWQFFLKQINWLANSQNVFFSPKLS